MSIGPLRLSSFFGNFVAVCYVAGRDNPPGRRRSKNPRGSGPRGFLGLYFSRVEEARLSFLTFDTTGYDRDFQNVCSKKDKFGLEYALIHGFLFDAVPFDQWRPYPIGVAERSILRRLRIENEYDEMRYGLARVLHLARGPLFFSLDKFAVELGQDPKLVGKPYFMVRPRSAGSIRKDTAERDEIHRDLEKKSVYKARRTQKQVR